MYSWYFYFYKKYSMKSLSEFLHQHIPQHSENTKFLPNQYENYELYWHLVLEYSRKFINESYSFVQEICDLSPKIIKKIKDNIDKNIINFTDLNASFFNKLELEVQHREDLSKIVNGETDIDYSTKEEIYLQIELNKNDYDDEELKDTIEHELVHLYQTIHHKKNNKSLRASLDKRFYDNYTSIEDIDDHEDHLKFIIYLIQMNVQQKYREC